MLIGDKLASVKQQKWKVWDQINSSRGEGSALPDPHSLSEMYNEHNRGVSQGGQKPVNRKLPQ
jgi:hypothetical protein